jgi:hypothetical protein
LTDDTTTRTKLTEAVRSANDLSDVCRAIAVATRLMGEKLDALESDLLTVLATKGERPHGR